MTTTKYTHRVTIVVPELMLYKANQLALIVGESLDDVNTFTSLGYQDSLLNKYSACSTVATSDFLAIPTVGLPNNPYYAPGADRAAAQDALDSINQPGGLMMNIDSDPKSAIAGWGLEPIPEDLL